MDFFVCGKAGDDNKGNGSFEKPFKSIYKVKEAIRDVLLNALNDDITVYVKEGNTFLTNLYVLMRMIQVIMVKKLYIETTKMPRLSLMVAQLLQIGKSIQAPYIVLL